MSSNNTLLYGDSPLACAWLASSLEKKLSKRQYLNTSITDSARAIEQSSNYINSTSKSDFVKTTESDSQLQFLSQPHSNNGGSIKREHEPMALRISGQLLYGVVKIYSRKTRYLFEEVSLALIQLKSAFTITKSITVPIEQTIIPSLDSITLKDTVTEANVLYDAENFNLEKVFGIDASSNRNTQSWETSHENDEHNEENFSQGDISVGRNDGQESDFTGNVSTTDLPIPEFDNNADAENYEVGNESIDALARRAQAPADDLDGADEFDLPLDLDFKPAQGEDEAGEVAGISDFQLSAVDNMDLEFSVDEANNSVYDVLARENANGDKVEQDYDKELAENTELSENEEIGETKSGHRRYKKRAQSYKITDVVRTQRKRLIVDNSCEIPTDQLKKNQREYPSHLKELQLQYPTIIEINMTYDNLIEDLQPYFLNKIGSTWKSIKRRRLISEKNYIENNNTTANPSIAIGKDRSPAANDEGNLTFGNEFHEIPDYEDIIQNTLEPPNNSDSLNVEADRNDAPNSVLENNSEKERDDNQEAIITQSDEDEVIEDFMDPKVKSKTTIEVAQELRKSFESNKGAALLFDDVVESCNLSTNRKSRATRTFFELLVLGSGKAVKLNQDRLFGEITVEAKEGLYENFL